MSNALHDYASLFERYSANNGGTGVILAGEDCLSLANEMRMDADAIDVENDKLRKLAAEMYPYAKAFLQQGVMLGCNDTMSYDWFLQLRELGIEVDNGAK